MFDVLGMHIRSKQFTEQIVYNFFLLKIHILLTNDDHPQLDVRYAEVPTTQLKKALGETQTLRAGCSKAEPKNFAPPLTPFPGRPEFNQLEMVTTFTYKPSLVRIDARNFELSW